MVIEQPNAVPFLKKESVNSRPIGKARPDWSVPKRGSVGWVSKCWQLLDTRYSPDATANRYWPVSELDRLVATWAGLCDRRTLWM